MASENRLAAGWRRRRTRAGMRIETARTRKTSTDTLMSGMPLLRLATRPGTVAEWLRPYDVLVVVGSVDRAPASVGVCSTSTPGASQQLPTKFELDLDLLHTSAPTWPAIHSLSARITRQIVHSILLVTYWWWTPHLAVFKAGHGARHCGSNVTRDSDLFQGT